MFNIFANQGLCNITTPSVSIAKVKAKSYQYLTFNTKSLKEWNILYALWYKDGKKKIPENKILVSGGVQTAPETCRAPIFNKIGDPLPEEILTLISSSWRESVIGNIVGDSFISFSSCCKNDKHILNPYFVTGFMDGEGCFLIKVAKNKEYVFNYQILAWFKVKLHKKDRRLLELIQAYFNGVGKIYYEGNSATYVVSSVE